MTSREAVDYVPQDQQFFEFHFQYQKYAILLRILLDSMTKAGDCDGDCDFRKIHL